MPTARPSKATNGRLTIRQAPGGVGDRVWGASAFWTDTVRLDFSVTDRSKEYYGQPFKDRFGMIDVTVRL